MKMSMRFQKKLLASLITTSMIAIGTGPTTLFAQASTANLRGAAPANTTITARNVATGSTRSTKTAADGSYTLVGLQPGTYAVDAGAGTEKTVTLTVASTATLNLSEASAQVVAPAGTTNLNGVTVTANTLKEVKTSEVGSTISLHQINTIPQVSRNFLEFADTVPGMVFTRDSSGNTSLRGGAMNDSSTNVYIDGVGQKSYVKEGGVSGQNASQGNPFPQLAIGEYKVITSNYKAEYDQVSSAAVVAQTKSGTNEFHGQVFGTFTNSNMRAQTPAESDAGQKTSSHEKEYGFSLGGPIIKDQMHFFVTYEGKEFDTPITVTPGVTGINNLLPADVVSQFGPANLPFKENLYFGKIDWEPTARDRFELSAQRRQENQVQGIGVGTAASSAVNTVNNDTRYDIRWQHSGDAYFNEVLFTHENAFNNPTPVQFGNGFAYTYAPNNDASIISVGPANALATQRKGQSGPALQEDLTFNDFEWHGDHVIKMGAKYKEVTLDAQDAGLNNPQFTYNVTPDGTSAIPYSVFFPYLQPGYSAKDVSEDKQFGTYIQDDWAVNDKLILNLGVRWDYEKNPSYLNYVTPASLVESLNSQDTSPDAPVGQTYAQSLAKGGIDVDDYISNGHNRKAYKGEIQPRLGFSYDLNADQAHVIFGGAGRSYDRDLYDYLQTEQTKTALPQLNYYFQDPATGQCYKGQTPCVPWNPAYFNGLGVLTSSLASSTNGQEVDMINNKLKAPYSDQFSIGMRNKLGEWDTSTTIARVLSYNGFAYTAGARNPDGSFWKYDDAAGQVNSSGNNIPNYGGLVIGNSGIRTRTTQVLLSAEKPYTKQSGWSATFAYTYTRAYQNRDINEHYSFDEATIGDYPFIRSNAAAKHRFVASGAIDVPYGLTLSAKLTLATPIPYNTDLYFVDTTSVFPNGAPDRPVALTPPGTGRFLIGGKIFGYRDIDLQASKDFYVSGQTRLYARLDLLNVFNWKNYSDYTTVNSSTMQNVAVTYTPNGNIVFVPRTLKLQVGLEF